MELIDLPEIYERYPKFPGIINYLVSDNDIDMINNFILELPHDSMSARGNKIDLKLNSIIVCEISPSFISVAKIVVQSTHICIYIPEETFIKIRNLGHLFKLPYDYFYYVYDTDRDLLEPTLKRIKNYGTNRFTRNIW